MSWYPRNNVLVPIDFSEASWEALEVAKSLAAESGQMQVVHVLAPIYPASPGVIWEATNLAARREAAQAALRVELEKRAISAEVHIEEGDPGWSVASLAEKLDADLVVVPSHGRSGIKRLVMGSVAERIARHAPCPVLILRRNNS